ncbi:AzlD domain-containing protein [Microbacterium gorillae]|uniref:AzlD domain-containing protein n=1 Tax=Microbacterium gorillae TaxID=1231063 RepID=UPI003D9541A7
MTLWQAILLASILCVVAKILGYAIPPHWLEKPTPARTMDLTTVALLAALVAYLALHGPGQSLHIDARLAAVGVAAVLLALRAPFVLVVIAGAVTAALLRLWGWAS